MQLFETISRKKTNNSQKQIEMKNMETIFTGIDTALSYLEGKLVKLEDILSKLRQVKSEINDFSTDAVSPANNIGVNAPVTITSNAEPTQNNEGDFLDYPFHKRLRNKLDYLDSKFPRAWKMRDRLELIRKIEGSTSELTGRNMSQDLQYLVNTGIYVGAKYNNYNQAQFYCRREWLNEDGKSIRDKFKPAPEDLMEIPAHRRGDENIVWITGER